MPSFVIVSPACCSQILVINLEQIKFMTVPLIAFDHPSSAISTNEAKNIEEGTEKSVSVTLLIFPPPTGNLIKLEPHSLLDILLFSCFELYFQWSGHLERNFY